jgi:hypothetical protein
MMTTYTLSNDGPTMRAWLNPGVEGRHCAREEPLELRMAALGDDPALVEMGVVEVVIVVMVLAVMAEVNGLLMELPLFVVLLLPLLRVAWTMELTVVASVILLVMETVSSKGKVGGDPNETPGMADRS